jgi:predicted PurR-regulated permease PerM
MMTTESREAIPHWRFWLGAFIGLIFLLWALSPILLPFVVGLALAYFLDPIVDWLERYGAARWLGAIAALVVFVGAFSLLFILLAPLVQTQLATLIEQIPSYVDGIKNSVVPWVQENLGRFAPNAVKQLQAEAGKYAGEVASVAGNVLSTVVHGGGAVFSVVSLLVVTPVVAFYMLRDWDTMMAAMIKILPQRYAPTIKVEMAKVDATLAGFLRGQALVCLCLALYYAIALSFVGLDFGIAIGDRISNYAIKCIGMFLLLALYGQSDRIIFETKA